jgi:hypothetical protein
MKLSETEPTLAVAAAKAGMSEKTARKYRRAGGAPSQRKLERSYRTRRDAFVDVWAEVVTLLEHDEGLQARTIFDYLCRIYPDRFQESQVRTLQRRIKVWRGAHGSNREVFFPQLHVAGRQAQSDFTYMTELHVTIARQPFDHLLYHFVLTYSNWEWVTVCFSESFEALADGVQTALWRLGGVPREHRTDSMSAAVTTLGDRDEFTARYQGLLDHYRLRASHTSVGRGNENGDVEQSHHRVKTAIDQELRLRGSRDFADRAEYRSFLEALMARRNHARRDRVHEDIAALGALPVRRLDDFTGETVKVTRNSTVLVRGNFYSVPSRLIGEHVAVRIYGEHIELWYGGEIVESIERLRGKGKYRVDYRHVIDSLVRKPGAFAACRYQQSLFPQLIFRIAYDVLCEEANPKADREYVRLLEIAAKGSEETVAEVLGEMLARGETPRAKVVLDEVERRAGARIRQTPRVDIDDVNLEAYDAFLTLSAAEEVTECLA